MGVQGLWDLLAPVGRRVSVETLAGRKLAIDASIWIIQFMKAMRDEKGEMVRNAHILGFFRRICKLLYLRTKPVFVFDGGTPSLKRRTVIARRRQRENAQAKIRKTAEKLLLNHLKALKLKELATDLGNQRKQNDPKGKKVITEPTETMQNTAERNGFATENHDKEALDEMLAASIQAEEGGNFADDASASCGWAPAGNDDTDEDEEMILPAMHGKVDPSVLAALPPSMQLDLLGQMRERLMAENRQKYQKVKKAPEKFSELQIQAYLKTVAFRREIDEVRKSAAGRGIGGVRTSRIASEANREFVFSSSFTGDKGVLASAGEDQARKRASEVQPENNVANATGDAGTRKSSSVLQSIVTEPGEAFDDDVETYMDERGHLRVSRLRAMGIRMTRDLQRNLDMMKEIEEESIMSRTNDLTDVPTVSDTDTIHPNSSIPADDGTACLNSRSEEPDLRSGTSIEISFEDDFERTCANDDDVFARLVAGDPAAEFSINRSPTIAQSPGSDSDVEWEEGVIEEKDDMLSNSSRGLDRAPREKDDLDSETEVEWEEGCLGICKESSLLPSGSRSASKGAMEEEADFQEAVKRSLEDLRDQISIDKSLENEMSEEVIQMVTQGIRTESVDKEHDCPEALDSCLLAQIGEQLEANSSYEKMEIVKEIGQAYKNLHGCIHSEPTISLNGSEINTIKKKMAESTGEVSINKEGASDVNKLPNTRSSDAQQYELGAASRSYIHETTANAFPEGFISDISSAQKLYEEGASDGPLMEGKDLSSVWGSAESIEDQKAKRASLEEEMHELDKERDRLGDEKRKLERNAESISSEMFTECQELLQMFGLPYIIAPMEAEAQCAYMELTNLVDGVVTDDSDAFLFGARSVYKNIFDDRKYVETYLMKDMENELGLDREKLIRMALLLGSDYTEGVSGIGIVNAIEVVNAFPEKDGLQKFREWVESPDPSILGGLDTQAGSSSSRRGCKVGDTNNFLESEEGAQKLKQVFMNKHRNISKNWHIPSSFPSTAVISAYDSPQVDKSTEPFAWGKPDVSSLRKVCWEKFGWSSQKSDELLIPVLKEYNKHETQLRMEAFYTFNERFAKIRSKRIKKAVKHMTGSKSKDMDVENIEDPSNEEIKTKRKSVGKQSRKRKGEQLQTEQLEPPEGASGGGKNTSKRSAGSRKGGPRETAQSAGKASKKSHSGFLKTSSEGERDSDIEQPSQIEELEKPNQTRRSERRRKAVNYTETKDDDTDKADPRNGDSTTEKLEQSESQAADMGPTTEHHPTDSCKMNEIDVSNYLGPRRLSDFQTSADVDRGGVQPSFSETDDPPAEDILCKEYLKMGGGFCLEEEDGDDMEQEINASSPSREIGENETELDIDIVTDNASHKASEIQESTENNDNMSGSVFLRAMPNLRKRKKSS